MVKHPTKKREAHRTVHAAFVRSSVERSNGDFLHVESVTGAAYGLPMGATTWKAAAQRIEVLHEAYASAGYGHGHRVGLLLENRPAFFFHWLALNALGVSIVPIDAELRSAECAHLVGHSGIDLAVCVPDRAEALGAAAHAAGRALPIALHVETSLFDEVRFPAPAQPARRSAGPAGRDSECALLYAPTATGQVKGRELSNARLLDSGDRLFDLAGPAQLRHGVERFITSLALADANALAFAPMAAILSGGCIVQLDGFHPVTWSKSVRESRATIVECFGARPGLLLAAPPSDADRDHQVRFGLVSGVDVDDRAAFEERFGFPLLDLPDRFMPV